MATITTPDWTGTGAPQMQLEYSLSSNGAGSAVISYTAYFIGHSPAYTDGSGRAWSVSINGSVVKSGSYNINQVTGTKTLGSGTVTINKTHSTQSIPIKISFNFEVTWSGVYGGTKTASGTQSIGSKTSYTVSYNANGGSGAPSNQTKWYGETLTLSSTKPTRTGYTFLGWSTSSTATSATYAAGGSYTANAAATLYAVWKINTYTVSYNANGGSGAPSSQTKTYGVTLTLSSTKPTRSGYTFQGWGTSSSDTSVDYAAGGSYTSNSSITLYAIWSKTITITYNANNGSGAPSSQSATVYNATTSYTFTLSSTKPTRTGYTFLGWSTSSSATSASYNGGSSYSFSSSTTLYAVWKIITYTISYNANGGSGAPSSQTKTYGATLTLSSTIPARTGYDFLGWSTSSTATSATYSASGSYTTNASATLYAVWKLKTYTVSYNKNTTDTVSGMPSSQTKTYGQTLVLSSTVPTRQRYNFLGWSTSSTGDVVYQPGGNYTINAAVTLYAVWELAASRVTVYDKNGNALKGLAHIYDSNGNLHYAIITIYDSSGNAHNVI